MKTKFALVNGQRKKPQPCLKGTCEVCGDLMDAKCGDIRIHHWAHRGYRICDTWWEPETEWHRDWKGHFHDDWQEVVHRGEKGEKHRADVTTEIKDPLSVGLLTTYRQTCERGVIGISPFL